MYKKKWQFHLFRIPFVVYIDYIVLLIPKHWVNFSFWYIHSFLYLYFCINILHNIYFRGRRQLLIKYIFKICSGHRASYPLPTLVLSIRPSVYWWFLVYINALWSYWNWTDHKLTLGFIQLRCDFDLSTIVTSLFFFIYFCCCFCVTAI